jgi:hypothetical protein
MRKDTLAWAALPLGRNLPLSPQSGLYLRFMGDICGAGADALEAAQGGGGG